MINVIIKRDKDKVAKGIEIKGHAGYGEYGQDIICAAVSSLALNMASVSDDGGYFSFSFPDEVSSESQLLMKSLILGLQNIQRDYGAEYINFRFREV